MDLELLKRFYIVSQAGTLEKAAEKLHIAQSAIGRSIAMFEDQMKTKLFDRLPKGMQLTPQGERLFNFAKQMLEMTDVFEKDFHENDNEISGDIRIITTPFIGTEWLVPILSDFLKQYPAITPKILLKSENIDLNIADIAICSIFPHQPHLIQEHLFVPQIKLFASPSYLNKFGTPLTTEDLDRHRLITYRGNYYTAYGSTNWVLNVGIKPGQASRKSYLEIDSLSGMLNSALQGYGIAELPNLSSVVNSRLEEVLTKLDGPLIELYYIFPEKRRNSQKIRLLFNYLSQKCK